MKQPIFVVFLQSILQLLVTVLLFLLITTPENTTNGPSVDFDCNSKQGESIDHQSSTYNISVRADLFPQAGIFSNTGTGSHKPTVSQNAL